MARKPTAKPAPKGAGHLVIMIGVAKPKPGGKKPPKGK